MANIFDGFLKQVATGDSIKDYRHASRLFIDNNYARSPKYQWLYHVFFDINPQVSNIDNISLVEAGMLVKSVKLPDYSINAKTQNNYNKKEIVQTKLNYNSIDFTFHDDQSEVVRNLWYDYYTHYYRDNDGGYADRTGRITENYHANNKYQLGDRQFFNNFGYTPRTALGPALPRYFTAIRIYSLHQKRFSEYTLINPVITHFSHGQHATGSQGTLEHNMQIDFTSVLYAGGNVSTDTVKGFADLHYDKSPSPLTPAGGGTNSILGPGGILSAIDSIVGESSGGNFGAAAFTAFRAFNKNKNVDLKGLAKGELIQVTKDILRSGPQNAKNKFFVPTTGVLANSGLFGGSSSAANSGGITELTGGTSNGNLSSNGDIFAISGGSFIASQLSSSLTGFPGSNNFSEVTTNSTGQTTGAPVNKILNFAKSSTGLVGTSEVTSPEFSQTLLGKVGQIGKNLQERVSAVVNQDSRSATGVTNGLVSLASSETSLQSAPTFVAGTNTLAVTAQNILGQTPFSNMNVPKKLAVASAEAGKFLDSGNLQDLVGERIPTSTNPSTS